MEVTDMYAATMLMGLMLLFWAAAIWASFSDDSDKPSGRMRPA
jgi:hypothetical protein